MGNGRRKRRTFCWPDKAKQWVEEWQQRAKTGSPMAPVDQKRAVAQLSEISGNPHDACLRLLRRIGAAKKRTYREWTKPEQQRLVDLIDRMPVTEAARILGRPVGSVHQMLRRLGLSSRQLREYFTPSMLAQALHISRAEIQRWIDRGWLPCRTVSTSGVGIKIIDADDFCDFIKNHGRNVVGNRLTYEGLLFVRNYVVPPSHSELLSVRGTYKKRAANASEPEAADVSRAEDEDDSNVFDQSA